MKKNTKQYGLVSFVGAGPGDPGLITVKGAACLACADVVVHDLFVHQELLQLAPQAKLIYVGKDLKKKRHAYVDQAKINSILLRYARTGKKVVRLKGGDPFIFGRGGEEALYLKKRTIPFEVVPGVSAGHGVPAYAGIPLTDRSKSSLAVFVTGHEDVTKKDASVRWAQLARLDGTLVLFMGIRKLAEITKLLLRHGKPAKTPVSVIENGSLPEQRVIEADLKTIASKAKKEKVTSPSLVVIGEVNRLRKRIDWFQRKSLRGKNVLLTRASGGNDKLKVELNSLGANVLENAVIEIKPPKSYKALDKAVKDIASFDWIYFASANAVDGFMCRLWKTKKDTRALKGIKIAAVGSATAESLKRYGIQADEVPERFNVKVLVAGLKRKGEIAGKKILLPRTNIASDALRQELEDCGAKVVQVSAYRTLVNRKKSKQLETWLSQGSIDYVTFTSASTVRGFVSSLSLKARKRLATMKHNKLGGLKLAVIGPETAKALRASGLKPDCTAATATLTGLVRALVRDARAK